MTRMKFFAIAAVAMGLNGASAANTQPPPINTPGSQPPPNVVQVCCKYPPKPGMTAAQFKAICTQAGGTVSGGTCQILGRKIDDPPPDGMRKGALMAPPIRAPH